MNKSIVVYYTWSGKTRKMAEIIAAQTGAGIVEIIPQTPYTNNYNAVVAQAKAEIQKGYLPPIQRVECDLSQYKYVYVGTPIWWGTMAPPVATFLSENNFDGKIIMPFTTHGGGGKGHSDRDIAKMCKGATVADMFSVHEGGGKSAEKELAAWIKKNEIEG